MQTRPPTATRILIAAGFALSCFGLALFLWLAFGGPVPLKPESYRFAVPFDEATQLAVESDVRISGVSVGKVKEIQLSDDGLAEATIEMDAAYAPIPTDTRAQLREKTLLGETYVDLTTGSGDAPTLEEGGSLPRAQVADSVQLDEIFRAFDEPTRVAFQAWMQGQSQALRGRGDDLSLAIASLDPFAAEADRALRVLDSQRLAVRQFIRDGGEVFEALSERRGQLRGLISNSNAVFSTTAARDAELAETFRVFPTFLRESRTTLERLERFARDTDPLVQQLRPAARELSPTLVDLGELAPELRSFFAGFDRTISASIRGLPALRKTLRNDLEPIVERFDPWLAELNSILEGAGLYRRELTAFLANVAATTQGTLNEGDQAYHFLRTSGIFNPEALAGYPGRLGPTRSNPYTKPGGFDLLATGLESFETRHCGAAGLRATLNPADAGAFPGDLFDRIRDFAFDGKLDSDLVAAPPCVQQPPFDSIGAVDETTQYLHTWPQP